MNVRHLLEKHELLRPLFKEVNRWLSDTGIYLKKGTIVDATVIEAISSTKKKTKERDLEMHPNQKEKQWFFGLKAPIGIDAKTELTRSVSTATPNIFDILEATNSLYDKACFISVDSGCRGAQKQEELKGVKTDWLITAIFFEKMGRQNKGLKKALQKK